MSPRKTAKKTAVRAAVETAPEVPIEAAEGDDSAFNAIGDDRGFVRIVRLDEREKSWVPHGKLLPSEATWERVAELFGGGKYRLVGFKKDEAGHVNFEKQTTVVIPGPYKPPTGDLPGMPSRNAASSPPGRVEVGTVGGTPTSAETLNAALVNQVIEMMQANRRPGVEWGALLAALAPTLTELIKAMTGRKDEGGKLNDMVLRQMEKLGEKIEHITQRPAQPTQPATTQMGDLVAAIREVLELKDMMEGKESGGERMPPEFGMVEKMLGLLQGGKVVPAPVPTGAPTPAAVAAMPIWQRLLLGNKRILLSAAARGRDGSAIAQALLDLHVPEEAIGSVKELLQRPDCGAVVVQAVPELAQFPKFTEEFLTTLAEELLAPEVSGVELPPGEEEGQDVE